MTKLRAAIIFGGRSSEHEVSISSARAVIKFFPEDNFDLIVIGITKEGKWLYCPDIDDVCENNRWFENPLCEEVTFSLNPEKKGFIKINSNEHNFITADCVFPILHGRLGEDGTLQGIFEIASMPYVGCNVSSSSIAIDKDITHRIMQASGITMARWITVLNSDNIDFRILYKHIDETLGFPVIIKPACEGSSFGISKAHNYEELASGLNKAFEFDNKVVIEETITGFEIGCAVLEREGILTIGNIDEIEIKKDFFDYEEKYTLKSSKIILPARICPELQDEVKKIAASVYKALDCYGLARVDMFITKDKTVILNEVNTLPGFTDKSRYPNMLKSIGIEFAELIEALLQSALQRKFSI